MAAYFLRLCIIFFITFPFFIIICETFSLIHEMNWNEMKCNVGCLAFASILFIVKPMNKCTVNSHEIDVLIAIYIAVPRLNILCVFIFTYCCCIMHNTRKAIKMGCHVFLYVYIGREKFFVCVMCYTYNVSGHPNKQINIKLVFELNKLNFKKKRRK